MIGLDDRKSLRNPEKTLLRRLLEVVIGKGTPTKYGIHMYLSLNKPFWLIF